MADHISFEKLNSMKEYILEHINNLSIDHRKEILAIILTKVKSTTGKFQKKGGGTQIYFCDIPPPVIVNIHKYVQTKVDNNLSRTIVQTGLDD